MNNENEEISQANTDQREQAWGDNDKQLNDRMTGKAMNFTDDPTTEYVKNAERPYQSIVIGELLSKDYTTEEIADMKLPADIKGGIVQMHDFYSPEFEGGHQSLGLDNEKMPSPRTVSDEEFTEVFNAKSKGLDDNAVEGMSQKDIKSNLGLMGIETKDSSVVLSQDSITRAFDIGAVLKDSGFKATVTDGTRSASNVQASVDGIKTSRKLSDGVTPMYSSDYNPLVEKYQNATGDEKAKAEQEIKDMYVSRSKHVSGDALDFRGKNMTPKQRLEIEKVLEERGYNVFIEGAKNGYAIHVEW